jgi:cob(I)alamin adenosyltransferase
MKIYTRTGDSGTTSLFSGGRVRKDHLRVEAYGTIDELNSVIGTARAFKPHPIVDTWLEVVQNHLFHLGADLATPLDAKSEWVVRIDANQVKWLEDSIDEMDQQLAPLRHFILPGGTPAAAQIHIARTVCRRAERIAVALAEAARLNDHILPYINRLSDWLFTAARYENLQQGVDETRWGLTE